MGRAKDIVVRPIKAADARRIVKALHYSGKVTGGSQVHLGVFLDGRCGGAVQFGSSINRRGMVGLVVGTKWNEFIELNRMVMADWLPRNGESRVLSVAMRLLRKEYPFLKWVVSFADACQCGDGTIYRASGFVLTGIKKNSTIYDIGSETKSDIAIKTGFRWQAKRWGTVLYGADAMRKVISEGAAAAKGFQLRYIYFLHPEERKNLVVPEIPFSEIDKRGAGMYRGKTRVRSDTSDTPSIRDGKGGAAPTLTL